MFIPSNQNSFSAGTDLEDTTSSVIDFDQSSDYKLTLKSTDSNQNIFDKFSVSSAPNETNTDAMLNTQNLVPIPKQEGDILKNKHNHEINEWNKFNPFKIFTKPKKDEEYEEKSEFSLRLRRKNMLLSPLATQQKFFENVTSTENNNKDFEKEVSEINSNKHKTASSNRKKHRIINSKDEFPALLENKLGKEKKNEVSLSLDSAQLSKTKFKREAIPYDTQSIIEQNEPTSKEFDPCDQSYLKKDKDKSCLTTLTTDVVTALKGESETNLNLEQLSGETLNSVLCSNKFNELTNTNTKNQSITANTSKEKDSEKNPNEIALKIKVNLSEQDCDFLQTFTGITLDENFKNKPKLLLSAYLTVIYEAKIASLKKDKEIKELKDALEALNREKILSHEMHEANVQKLKEQVTELKSNAAKQTSEIKTLLEKFDYSSNLLRNEYDVISRLYSKIKELKQQHLDFELLRQYFNDYIVAYSRLVTSLITHTFESRNSMIKETIYLKESQNVQGMLNLLSRQNFIHGFFKKKKNVDTQRKINSSYFVEINRIMGKFLNSIYQA